MSRKKNDGGEVGEQTDMQKESKADKFVRLAPRRVTKAIKALDYVANLGRHGQYDYTEDQAAKVTTALINAMKRVVAAFSGEPEKPEGFTL